MSFVLRILIALVLSLGSVTSYAGAKTDIIILKNGDRVTGEIKKLEAGLLELKTDTMGTVYIEWRFISELFSDKTHSVEDTSGNRWLGRLQKPEEGDDIEIDTFMGPIDLEASEIVAVWPVAATFLDKMDLNVAVGFDYASSTDITNFNLSVDFKHRSDKRISEASLRSDITRQNVADDQNRQELNFSQQYLRPNQKFRSWIVGLDSNDALGIDLRVYGGGTAGKYFVKTNNKLFYIAGGLLATEENPTEGSSQTNLEGVGSVRYRYWRFADPERSFDTTLSVYPSLTDFGRVRADMRSTFRLEFFKDLFWSMEFYANYDNQPLSEDAEKADYGIVTGLGWSY